MERRSLYPVLPEILQRWSPRAMSGEVLSEQELKTIFEAARWAQSSYNNQPWRFVYARKDTPAWKDFFGLLVPFNQGWCIHGAVLIVVLSHKHFSFNEKDARTSAFDAGAACENMAIQARSMGLVCHGMEGFDYDKAHALVGADEHYAVQAMFVLGRPAESSVLSSELREREKPSDRLELEKIVFEGSLRP